ncbi:hypothetical protein M2281_005541 [Mesorhizobium soli]|uniref:hypothetical protein n=1 Tax=Pseudaminobacter soli (ex Li et al. 2025) TaxID=1295366 RepID=UPI0024743286|nr:hypothetical protein [Mesorhizobium soli]MDH6234920.1 hypothetical protein [Mesorhizobium soli]
MTIDEFEAIYTEILGADFSIKSAVGKSLFPDDWFGHLIEADEDLLISSDNNGPYIRLCDEIEEWCTENGMTVECDSLPIIVVPHPDGYDQPIMVEVLRFETVREMVHYKLRWLDN